VARNPRFTAVHKAEDQIRPRFARAFLKWARTIKAGVDRRELVKAIRRRNIKAAQVLFRIPRLEAPMGAILRDARQKGRRLARRGLP